MKRPLERWEVGLIGLVLAAGFALRLRVAMHAAFNPDEALHAVLAFGTWGQTLQNALRVTHPPLLAMATYLVTRVSHAEVALRMVPLVAGSLFPLLLFFWVRRVVGDLAGLGAFVVLTLSPNLIGLSAQVRSYTLALLFLAAALVVLEEALGRDRWEWMAGFSVLLWLCVASDYSMAWAVGGLGVYALMRLGGCSIAVKAVWAAGQVAAIGLYGFLYVIQVGRFRGGGVETDAVTGWLRGGFPQPGGILLFPIANTAKQFKYLTGSTVMGGVGFVLFAVAIVLLWRVRRTRALAALLAAPFLLAMAGACVRIFPYGATRHTVVLGVLGAIGIATLLEYVPRWIGVTLLGGLLVAGSLWQLKPSTETFPVTRNEMTQCVDYMRAAIPQGTPVFADQAIVHLLTYYAGDNQLPPPMPNKRAFVENFVGGRWRLAIRDYQYYSRGEYQAALEAFRKQYGFSSKERVWVLDGGWAPVSGEPDDGRPSSRAMRVFQTSD
jgi:Dolichyl-phosphate-mannose-protein mannosyltransferase